MLNSEQTKVTGVGTVSSPEKTLLDKLADAIDPLQNPDIKIVSEPTLTISTKPGFNPDTKGDPRRDDDSEGGIALNRTSTRQDATGYSFQPQGSNKEDTEILNKYEVSGFTIQYIKKGETGYTSEPVNDYYDKKEDAMIRFSSTRYIRPDGIIADITFGAPILCYESRQLMEYVDSKWRRS